MPSSFRAPYPGDKDCDNQLYPHEFMYLFKVTPQPPSLEDKQYQPLRKTQALQSQ